LFEKELRFYLSDLQMPQEDYIKREIDRLGKVLAKALADLLGTKARGNSHEGLHAINNVLISELEIDLDGLLLLPESELLSYLVKTKKLNNAQMEILGDLLFESAVGEDPVTDAIKYRKTLSIYNAITENELTYSVNRHYKIKVIRQLLNKS
jgi:hypothetical protein